MTRPTIRLLVACVLTLCACEAAVFETEHGGIEEGNEALVQGTPGEALVAYEEAAQSVPESAGLNYDRGLALSELGRHDDATQMLLRALDARDAELRAKVLSALGLAYSRWGLHVERTGEAVTDDAAVDGPATPEAPDASEAALPKWERAVAHLEDALALMPADADVLRNLEIALLRVDPPCVARDDEAEPNDAASTPHSVTLEAQAPPEQSSNPAAPGAEESAQDKLTWKRALLACPGDAEWYAVHLEPGDRLTANLDATEGPSPLGLNLHTPGATRRLRPPSGQDELITSLELTSSSGGKGDYLLEVSNPETDEVPYGLEIVVRPACHRVEDHLEDNDTQFEAKDVTPGPIDGLKLCPGDPDWYAVTLADGESLFVFASPQGDEEEEAQEPQDAPPAPSLELSLYDEAGTLISDGAPADASRVATLLNPGEGRYLIRVGGPIDLETRYQLLVQVVPPCPDGDDQHEDNDMVEDATDLMALMNPQGGAGGQGGGQGGAPQPQLLRICPGDVDWFSFTSNPEAPTVVSLVFEHAKGDLGLRLTDPTGSETLETIDASSPQQNGEAVQIPKSQEVSSYALEVRARDLEENFYLLRLEQPQGGGEGSPESDDEEQEEPPEEQEEQEEEEEQEPPPPQEEEEEQTPLEDRLDKLDHNPNNLEALQKALESRRGPPEKDW